MSLDVYDTTLRDGSQREGLSLTVEGKLAISRLLDGLGVGFIEGGWPGASPKDTEFFRRARTELDLRSAQLAAFGATRRPGTAAAGELAPLRESGAPVVTLVAKASRRHVEQALRTTAQENLAMVRDSVAHLTAEGQRVFLDAEHFFDGYAEDRPYALEVLTTAAEAGAEVLVLCDTNGGMLPLRLAEVVREVTSRFPPGGSPLRVGIHAHDDTGCAVANSLAAVEAGAGHVQGTANGYGERCGNAHLFAVVAALEGKMGRPVLPEGRLQQLGHVAQQVAAVAGIPADPHQPWVGTSAFAHKAGLHASAVKADPGLYQHADPAAVGNRGRVLVSDLSGRAAVLLKSRELGLQPDEGTVERVLGRVKQLEAGGRSVERADGSFELLVREEMSPLPADGRNPAVESWQVQHAPEQQPHTATVTVRLGRQRRVGTGQGDSAMTALAAALARAVEGAAGGVPVPRLVSHELRPAPPSGGAARVEVLVTSEDRGGCYVTAAAGADALTAGVEALEQAVRLALRRGYASGRKAAVPSARVSPGTPCARA